MAVPAALFYELGQHYGRINRLLRMACDAMPVTGHPSEPKGILGAWRQRGIGAIRALETAANGFDANRTGQVQESLDELVVAWKAFANTSAHRQAISALAGFLNPPAGQEEGCVDPRGQLEHLECLFNLGSALWQLVEEFRNPATIAYQCGATIADLREYLPYFEDDGTTCHPPELFPAHLSRIGERIEPLLEQMKGKGAKLAAFRLDGTTYMRWLSRKHPSGSYERHLSTYIVWLGDRVDKAEQAIREFLDGQHCQLKSDRRASKPASRHQPEQATGERIDLSQDDKEIMADLEVLPVVVRFLSGDKPLNGGRVHFRQTDGKSARLDFEELHYMILHALGARMRDDATLHVRPRAEWGFATTGELVRVVNHDYEYSQTFAEDAAAKRINDIRRKLRDAELRDDLIPKGKRKGYRLGTLPRLITL